MAQVRGVPTGRWCLDVPAKLAGQPFPTHLHVECNKDLSNPRLYKVGTLFRIRAKLTDREGGGDFLYSYFGWPVDVAGPGEV